MTPTTTGQTRHHGDPHARRTPHTTAGVGPDQAITVGPNGLVILRRPRFGRRRPERVAIRGSRESVGGANRCGGRTGHD